ncbi:MAG TPA: DUF2442 domain-containing protein [Fimbriimonadaceae bacterium]
MKRQSVTIWHGSDCEGAPSDGPTVRLTLTDGNVVARNLSPLLRPLFGPILDDRKLFEAVGVEAGTLSWPNGLDLDPDMVIWGGAPPADDARRVG